MIQDSNNNNECTVLNKLYANGQAYIESLSVFNYISDNTDCLDYTPDNADCSEYFSDNKYCFSNSAASSLSIGIIALIFSIITLF